MKVNYDECNIKELKDNKCVKFDLKFKNNECAPYCKINKEICKPVQKFINIFLHK